MQPRVLGAARSRRLALVLLVALLPTVSYFGHWPALTLPIPGTAYVLTLPFSGEDAAPGDHAAHCHGESAGCTSGAGAGTIALALLAAAIALVLPAGPLVPVPVGCSPRLRARYLRPEHGPPRTLPSRPAPIVRP